MTKKLNVYLLVLIIHSGLIGQSSQMGGFIDEWANYPAGEFGPVAITFDSTNMRSLTIAPPVGEHPRVYFGADELTDIIDRMDNSDAGQEVFAQLHAYTTLNHLSYGVSGGYSHSATYGEDSYGNRRVDNAGKWNRHDTYYALINHDFNALDDVDNKARYLLASVMALEAFECLIKEGQNDPDTGLDYDDRASMLGEAMSQWAQIVLDNDPDLNWNNYHYFGGVHMALAYDMNYNAMTTNQQDSVRMALAEIIPAEPRYGVTTAPYATTSNWTGLNTFELLTNIAIEGEVGYNTTLTQDYMRAYRNFITYGWYHTGTPYEGLGKNYQFVTSLIVAAKRGYSLLPHPYVRKYGNTFLPAITQPYGHAFIGTDVWGGSGWNSTVGGYKNSASDIIGLKWMFPNDEKIDFVWRNYIEKYYKNSSEGYVYQQIEPATSGYHNYLLMAAIFASDYTDGDWAIQNETALSNSKSFFGEERGIGILRSGYNKDDMAVHFHCRQDLGGHTHGDRNNFTLSALGRTWIRYTYGSAFQETQYHSCPLIDDLGTPLTYKDGVKARQPGKVLSFDENGDHATIVGDATYAYSWEWHWETRPSTQDHSWLGTDNWEEVTESWNDFKHIPGAETFHSTPFYDYDNWNSGGDLERMIKRPYNTMEKVYRTLTMVRQTNPYVLVVDDIKKDSDVHNYKWLAQVANDLEVVSTNTSLDYNNYISDHIFGEPGSNKRLLIRVLNNNGQCNDSLFVSGNITTNSFEAGNLVYSDGVVQEDQNVNFKGGKAVGLNDDFETPSSTDFTAEIEPCTDGTGFFETVTPGINGNAPITRFVVEADVVSPDFKIMLYPHLDGDPLPVTKWNSDKTSLIVEWPTSTQTILFDKVNGRTMVSVQ